MKKKKKWTNLNTERPERQRELIPVLIPERKLEILKRTKHNTWSKNWILGSTFRPMLDLAPFHLLKLESTIRNSENQKLKVFYVNYFQKFHFVILFF